MLNVDIWEGYKERKQILNPIFKFGDGMKVGEDVVQYKQDILLLLLLEVFYRELKDDERRTRNDLIEIIKEITTYLQVNADEDVMVRMVDGILFSGQSTLRNPFTVKYFDEKSEIFKEQRYKYLTVDSKIGSKNTSLIYKLSEESQKIIFMSREILDELPIEIEQLYVIQLIKKGNLSSALKSVDVLITKIKGSIYKEDEYRINLKKDPKKIIYDLDTQKKKRDEFDQGIEERKDNFTKMYRLLEKMGNIDEKNKYYATELEKRINQTYKYNEILMNKVYENRALVTKIRMNPRWLLEFKKKTNFKEDIWENEILTGVHSETELDIILNSLFSPHPPIQFPVGWLFAEQDLKGEDGALQYEEIISETKKIEKIEFNWEEILYFWEPVFEQLQNKDFVRLSEVKNLDEWSKEAIEMWIMFSTNKETSIGNSKYIHKDDCIMLLQKLIEHNENYQEFKQKIFYTSVESNARYIECVGLIVSPYVLHIRGIGVKDFE